MLMVLAPHTVHTNIMENCFLVLVDDTDCFFFYWEIIII